MHSTIKWARRAVVLSVVAATVPKVVERLTPVRGGRTVAPTITGDTWPPVPVKTSR